MKFLPNNSLTQVLLHCRVDKVDVRPFKYFAQLHKQLAMWKKSLFYESGTLVAVNCYADRVVKKIKYSTPSACSMPHG